MAPKTRRPDSFYALGVRPVLADALAARGIVEPFPIQAAALPDALAGRDVLGRGRTGSGKTVAFALPLLERVLEAEGRRGPGRPRALVLVPTRELAVQVHETVEHLAKAVKLRAMTVFGGVRYAGQLRRLERGADVVIATPGRLEDLLEQGALSLADVGVVVLDEADMMADMGFLPPVTRILEQTPAGQRMLFSATLDADVARLVERFLTEPLVHEVVEDDGAPEAVHYLLLVRHDNKPAIVRELLTGGGRALAFTGTRFAAERLANNLTEAGIPAVDLHGNLRQGARQRNLAAFADGSVSVLVATDIAARGIHVDDVGLVLHVDPPNDPKAFLHRSGRTARAGSEGNVVTLATKNQNKPVRELMAQAGIKPVREVVTPGHELLTQLRAPRVEAAASGSSIFEPDPEDVGDDAPEAAPAPRARRSEKPNRPARRDDRDERGSRVEYRPRREPREHTTGRRGARPDAPRAERSRRPEQPWTAEWWGPEPWEVDDVPARADRRSGRAARADQRPRPGRDARAERRSERPERAERRPERAERRPERAERRPERTEQRGSRPELAGRQQDRVERPAAGETARGKQRWTAEDRRRRTESEALGFGYVKAGTKPGRVAKAGKPGKPGKPGKKNVGVGKDKGKPKRFMR